MTLVTILFRRGTTAQWGAANPVLEQGEPGYDTVTGEFKIGDGVTAWTSLAPSLLTESRFLTDMGNPASDISGAVQDVADTQIALALDANVQKYIYSNINIFNTINGSAFTALDQEFGRAGNPTTLPTSWSWFNQGSCTYEERFGAGVLTYPAPGGLGDNWRFFGRALTAVPTNYTVYAKFTWAHNQANFNLYGLSLRDSASGKFVSFHRFVGAQAIEITTWDNYTTLNTVLVSGYLTPSLSAGAIFRVAKVGTNYTLGISVDDGLSWITVGTYAITTFTPNQILIGGNSTDTPCGTTQTACHWLRIR